MEKAIIFLVTVLVFPTAYVGDHIVGGPSGWTINFNYTNWASVQNFTTGDTLVFTYGVAAHAVDEVTEADYVNCSTENPPISSNRTSPTIITLDTRALGILYAQFLTTALWVRDCRKIHEGSCRRCIDSIRNSNSSRIAAFCGCSTTTLSVAVNLAGENDLMTGLMSIGLMAAVGLVG